MSRNTDLADTVTDTYKTLEAMAKVVVVRIRAFISELELSDYCSKALRVCINI